MKVINIKKMQQQFVGSICTVLTVLGKQGFDNAQFSNCFVGLVESLDEDGIFIQHLKSGELSFFQFSHIVGIMKEHTEVLEPADPKIMETKSNPKKIGPFLDLNTLDSLVKQAMVRKEN